MHSFGKFLPTPSPIIIYGMLHEVSSFCMVESVCIIQSEKGIIGKDRPRLETSQSSVYNYMLVSKLMPAVGVISDQYNCQ